MLRARGRAGFTLLEVTVALLVVALLAGVIYTQVVGRVESGESAALAQNLSNLNKAALAFRADLGRYPGTLTQLSAPIASGALDSCGQTIPNAPAWRGPYIDRALTTSGLGSGTATIRNTLRRDPPTAAGTPFGTLFIEADGVDRTVALALARAFDNNTSLSSGSIRWSATENSTRGRLSFAIPVRGC